MGHNEGMEFIKDVQYPFPK